MMARRSKALRRRANASMTEKNEKDSQDPKEHLKLEGYKALMQYGYIRCLKII